MNSSLRAWDDRARGRPTREAARDAVVFVRGGSGRDTLAAMGDAAAIQHMSAAEYLAWERLQPTKHEYHLGEVFAMAGGSLRHNFLSGALVAELRAALRGKGCHVLTSDQRIAAKPNERYVYSDAVVVCGPIQTEPGTSDVLSNPRFLVEVLSKSTEAYDRGEKWEAYQRLPSLTDYMLVAQTSVRIEHYQREADGSWRYRELTAGDTLTLANGATLAIDAVYEGAFDLAGE
jgi:Uma2 family endonuclease